MVVPCGGGGCGGSGCGGSCSSGGGVVVFVVVVVLVVVVALVLAVVVGVVVLVYFSMSQNHNHNNDSRKERLATFDLLCSQGFQLSLACSLAVLLVYDVLVAPMWLLFTHDTPSAADALGKDVQNVSGDELL